jgi:hypothetical protein
MTTTVILYQPNIISNGANNGGRLSDNVVDLRKDGVGNFSAIDKSEQVLGSSKFRKLFMKVVDPLSPRAIRAVCFLDKTNLSDSTRSYLIAGTQRDTQSDLAGRRRYSTGKLHTAVAVGDTVLVVDFAVDSGADAVVQAGDKIVVIDGTVTDYSLTAQNVSWAGDRATITLTDGVTSALSTAAFVGSCLVDTVNINTHVDNVTKSFSTSTYDDVAYPIRLNNLGTTEQTVTFTITGPTTFSVLSDIFGALPNGSTLTDYAPINPIFGTPYLELFAAGWGGTHTVGEMMQFQTHPSALPVWLGLESFAGISDELTAVYPSLRLEI